MLIILTLVVGQTAQGKSDRPPVLKKNHASKILMPTSKGMTLNKIVWWQHRIIRHDLWVIRTRKHHRIEVVKWHRAQLRWTRRELKKSSLQLQLLLQSRAQPTLSGICQSCWDNVAYCESTGNWSVISKPYDSQGDTFKGGLQFTDYTWSHSGGTKYAATANLATRLQQIDIASKLSLSNWPVCGARY